MKAAIAFALLALFLFCKESNKLPNIVKNVADTVIVRDTVYVEKNNPTNVSENYDSLAQHYEEAKMILDEKLKTDGSIVFK